MFSNKGVEPLFSGRVAPYIRVCSDIESAMISVVESAVNCAIKLLSYSKQTKMVAIL
jgi:predicted thioredoxin/glutaredoxin